MALNALRCRRPADSSLRLAGLEVPRPQGCVSAQGFSLHAETSCASHQRQRPERMCRYLMRQALGHKRLPRPPAGEVVPQLKTPYRDGTTHLVMSPLEFLQRLVARVPGFISFASMGCSHPIRPSDPRSFPASPTRPRPPMSPAIPPRPQRRLA